MKTISMRRFRERAAEITEPVEISVRDAAGNFTVLGQFTPYGRQPTPPPPDPELLADLSNGLDPITRRPTDG